MAAENPTLWGAAIAFDGSCGPCGDGSELYLTPYVQLGRSADGLYQAGLSIHEGRRQGDLPSNVRSLRDIRPNLYSGRGALSHLRGLEYMIRPPEAIPGTLSKASIRVSGWERHPEAGIDPQAIPALQRLAPEIKWSWKPTEGYRKLGQAQGRAEIKDARLPVDKLSWDGRTRLFIANLITGPAEQATLMPAPEPESTTAHAITIDNVDFVSAALRAAWAAALPESEFQG